ncbi:MAG: hypothetical protein ACJ8M1_01960, partial [Chthoniobacterales bacterium]
IGWAPLPPEAGCELNVGVSSWVDSTCNIGPEFYTFINIRDFGADSYFGSGCIYDRGRNVAIIIDTFNLTNICWNRHVDIYCGGPDFDWCNTRIRQLGGKGCGRIHVNRFSDPARLGGKFARHEGDQLGLVSPRIRGTKHPKLKPQIAETAGADKIDHGWKGIKDKKQEQQVRNHIAQETKGRNPRNSPAKLPDGVAEKLKQKRGSGTQNLNQGGQPDALHPRGKRGSKPNGQNNHGAGDQTGDQGQTTGAAGDQHPGKRRHQGQGAAAGGNDAAGARATGQGAGAGFDQHPGKRRARNQGSGSNDSGAQGMAGNQASGAAEGANGEAGRGKRHPGQSFKHGEKNAAGSGPGNQTRLNTDNAVGGSQHPGAHDQAKGPDKGADQQAGGADSQAGNAGDKTNAEETGNRRRKGRRSNRQGTSGTSQTQAGSDHQVQNKSKHAAEDTGGGPGHGKKPPQEGTQANQTSGGQNGGGHVRGQQQQQQQQQQPQQQQKQQQIQQQGQKGGGNGRGGDRGRRRPPPANSPPG